MDSDPGELPNDFEALKTALGAERRERIARVADIEALLAAARAKASDDEALIAHQKLQIDKLRRELYGPRSERTSRILDQMELQLEELESAATEDEIDAERAAAKTTRSPPSGASARHASPFPSICRASGCSYRDRQRAFAAVADDCASWARPSPRHWNRSRANGR